MADQPPCIVVVDDTPSSLSLYERSIEGLAVDLRTFLSPGDALRHLTDEDADLVFVDILMREKDGVRFLRELRALSRHRRTEVVVVTSKDYDQDRALARQWGASEYLLKPLRSQEIREIIQRHTAAMETGANPHAR